MNFDCDKFKPYNKLIAETFYKAGLIESWGRGTQRIGEDGEKNVTENVTENREDLIIKLITENKNITTAEIAKKLNVVRRTVARDIDNLKTKGILTRIGSKGGYWKVNKKAIDGQV